jgi:magnesium transporter
MKLSTEDDREVDWIDLVRPSSQQLGEVLTSVGLPSVDLARYEDRLPQLEELKGGKGAFAVTLRVCGAGEPESLSDLVLLFFTEKALVTVHRKDENWLSTLGERWSQVKLGGPYPTLTLVAEILLEVIFSYETPLDRIEEQIDLVESHVFDNSDVPKAIKNIYVLKGQLLWLNRLHRLTIDLMGKLVIRFESQRHLFLNPLNEAESSFQFSDRMLDNLHHLINVQISLASHRTNEIVRVLTLFSVVFMPLTFIAGIYGMNFLFMPELRWRYGYPASLVGMGLIAAATLLWFRKKGWLK